MEEDEPDDIIKKDGRTETLKARREKRENKREKVVKYSLSGRLSDTLETDKKKEILDSIRKLVLAISKSTHKGAIVFNRMLLHCLKKNLELPDLTELSLYDQCFSVGIGQPSKLIPQVADTWSTYFDTESGVLREKNGKRKNTTMIFEQQKHFMCKINTKADSALAYARGYASSRYMTNFKTMLTTTFKSRQFNHVRRWCEKNDCAKENVYSICCAINNWSCNTKPPNETMCFIDDQKNILGIKNDDILSQPWIFSHMSDVVKYFYHILKEMENDEFEKKFTLAPICRIKNHFTTIDGSVLFYLLGGTKKFGPLTNFVSKATEHFSDVFKLKRPKLNGKADYGVVFNNMVDTDGVSICFHYLVPDNTAFDVKKEKNKVKNKSAPKRYGKGVVSKDDRVISVDPGRTNIIYGVEKLSNENIMIYKLTRRDYYTSAGINTLNAKTKKWNKSIEKENHIFSTVSLKTTDSEKWKQFLENYELVYDALWNTKTQRKIGRENFRVYCLKQKTKDKFIQKMVNGDGKVCGKNDGENKVDKSKKVGFAYGAARFNPSGRHELSVPTTSMSKRLCHKFSLEFVDEYNTTKMCNGCGKILSAMYKPFGKKKPNGKKEEIRGLRRCKNECKRLISRDRNAALNILDCFMCEVRPIQLRRNQQITFSMSVPVV
jgi:hypothetical protein